MKNYYILTALVLVFVSGCTAMPGNNATSNNNTNSTSNAFGFQCFYKETGMLASAYSENRIYSATDNTLIIKEGRVYGLNKCEQNNAGCACRWIVMDLTPQIFQENLNEILAIYQSTKTQETIFRCVDYGPDDSAFITPGKVCTLAEYNSIVGQ